MCRLSQWTVTSLLLSAYTQIHRRILSIFKFLRLPQSGPLGGGHNQMWYICFFLRWDLILWWILSVPNCCGLLKLIKTIFPYYAVWVAICRNLSGQELSVNSSSSCSFGIGRCLGRLFRLSGFLSVLIQGLTVWLHLQTTAPIRGHCVCVNRYHKRYSILYNKQGATAPFISPWPTKLLMFGEDMQSDQLHVPASFPFCIAMAWG